MEESLENLISYMEMEDEILNPSSNSFDEQEFLKDIILEQPECEPSFLYLCSNKIQNLGTTSAGTINNVEGIATSPTSSILYFDETGLMCDNKNETLIDKSNSPNSIMSLERSGDGSLPASYLLSFDNSSVEPIVGPMSHKRRIVKDKATKKFVHDHLISERKRRRELTENIIALSAMIPGLKKVDKCYVLSEAVSYTKQLQNRIKELENQNLVNSTIFKWKSQASSNKKKCLESLLEIEARVLEKKVLIRIHCEKQKDIVLNIHELLEKFNLTITSSCILPFGASILVINIFAEMDEEHSITMDDLVKNLKNHLVETCESEL